MPKGGKSPDEKISMLCDGLLPPLETEEEMRDAHPAVRAAWERLKAMRANQKNSRRQ